MTEQAPTDRAQHAFDDADHPAYTMDRASTMLDALRISCAVSTRWACSLLIAPAAATATTLSPNSPWPPACANCSTPATPSCRRPAASPNSNAICIPSGNASPNSKTYLGPRPHHGKRNIDMIGHHPSRTRR